MAPPRTVDYDVETDELALLQVGVCHLCCCCTAAAAAAAATAAAAAAPPPPPNQLASAPSLPPSVDLQSAAPSTLCRH